MTSIAEAPIFDADQHYYEPVDAFTRYCPKGWAERTVQLASFDGRLRLIVGGRVNPSIANPLFDPVAVPGALEEYFRGNPEGRSLESFLRDREPLPDYYRSPAARLAKLDDQRIDFAWMLPTVAMTIEEILQHDPEATSVAFHAFNRWLYDDWGFSHAGRIFSPPYLYMGEVDRAVQEVEWALERGNRIFIVRPTATFTREGRPPDRGTSTPCGPG